jgi:gamma-glutamyltranspeptidase/glutathione hydrolase
MMSPTIVLKDGQPEIVLGSGGSKRIRTAILQVISNLIDFEMPVAQAVESPRVHLENRRFHLEPGFAPEKVTKATLPHGSEMVLWNQKNMFFGGVNTVITNLNGLMTGAGDPRRQGVVELA